MSSPPPFSERLRFAEFVLDRLPNGRCRARVGLTWKESEQFAGENEGLGSQAGELRCAAQACVDALTQAVQGEVTVSMAVHGDGSGHRVVGSYLTENDAPRGAALAVLNATNRILGNRFFMR